MKQVIGDFGEHQYQDVLGAGGFAEQRYTTRVTAEVFDVSLDPLQRGKQIPLTEIGARFINRQVRV